MDRRNEAWERVLAAVEADARRAEALLRIPAHEALPADLVAELAAEPVPEPPLAVPANWVLPGEVPVVPAPTAALTELPPLAQMPPVPPELRERIEALQAQITELQRQLVSALEEWQPQRVVVTTAPQAQPVYVDRRV